MAVQTLKLAGREFVILPKREYAALKARANGARKPAERKLSKQDLGDLVEMDRRRKEPGRNIPWEQVKREMGLD